MEASTRWMAVAAVVLGIGLGSSPASALVLPGNGPDESDCYVGLDIGSATGAVIDDSSKKKVTVTCKDDAEGKHLGVTAIKATKS